MNHDLIRATARDRGIFINLMQLYMHDFSEFVDIDVQDNGLYRAYAYLEDYWKDDKTRFAYLIKISGILAGFVLVRFIEVEEGGRYSIAEFFIIRKYRRTGMGSLVAKQIFDLYKGNWEIFQKESNIPAQEFWTKVINEYTAGLFTDKFEDGKRIQRFQND
jgi:predicted acetyltransferase